MRYPRGTSIVLMAAVVLLLAASISSAGVVYVKWDSPGPTFDGASWDTAFHGVYAGLHAASPGDEVWVAKGTYVECITLKDGVGLYGGFTGTETFRDERNFRTNETILDGNQQGSVVTSPQGATTSTVIDGFTIRNGRGTGTDPDTYTGGGIDCDFSSPTIAHNRVTWNLSPGGSAIYSHASSAVVSDNVISGNGIGVAIYCYATMPTISGNCITGNTVGIGCEWCYVHFPTITNNTIVGNSGEGIYSNNSRTVITNNLIAFNKTGVYATLGPATLRRNCVYGNFYKDYAAGKAGADDIHVDPLLVCREYGNVHIQPGSPCRDVGLNDASGITPYDIDGQPRIQDAAIDIGADESDGSTALPGPYAIIRISPDGDDSKDGRTWESAKKTVQAGVDTASAAGGEVWVRSGTYTECVALHAYAYLYGGFAGTELARSERNWDEHETILDGGQTGSVVAITAGYSMSRIDGFTICNGSEGGIYCDGCTPTIAHNRITGNHAESGGGIFCYSASPAIVDNLIADNSATSSGGAIYCSHCSLPIITDNRIIGNSSDATREGGGGVYCGFECSATILRNAFYDNTAYCGGAIYTMNARPTIAGNLIIANVATGSESYCGGGGIYCFGSSPKITDNTIVGNASVETEEGAGGGGIYCYGSRPRVSNSIVAFNSSGICSDYTSVLQNDCVFGNTRYQLSRALTIEGGVNADPLFVNRAAGDYHLKLISPCVNAGWNDAPGLPSTDMDGENRILYGTVDIGADECSGTVDVMREAKMVANGVPVSLTEAIVTAAFDGFFYIEAENRSMGIRVEKADHGLKAGAKVSITGALKTNADGERFIEAETVTPTGKGSIAPLFINSRALGGGDWLYNSSTGAGQQGVFGGLGLNNIGMLVTTWGKLIYLGGADKVGDAKIEAGKEILDGVRTVFVDTYVRVTGVVSCYKDPDGVHPTILATEIIPL